MITIRTEEVIMQPISITSEDDGKKTKINIMVGSDPLVLNIPFEVAFFGINAAMGKGHVPDFSGRGIADMKAAYAASDKRPVKGTTLSGRFGKP